MIKAWLDIKEDTAPRRYTIYQHEGFGTTCILNRIWHRGDSSELSEIYKQIGGKETMFWASVPSSGMEIKKSHSGLPRLIVKTITNIIVDNYNGLEFENVTDETYWDDIAKENKFDKLLKKAISQTLFMGDGAARVSFDKEISEDPILEWFPGDQVDFVYKRKRLREIIFKSFHSKSDKTYMLKEIYGYGYVRPILLDDQGKEIALSTLPGLAQLKTLEFDPSVMWAMPLMFDESAKYEGRGASIFESKHDNFDSLDEIISQWIEAIRSGRARTYIPESLSPKDPETGEALLPNPYDNQFIVTESDLREGSKSSIVVEQAEIQSNKYLESYITFLDLCLQGVISPSTLGIDTKRHQDPNAAYERQMEKTTLYTRQNIIEALNEFIPALINVVFKAKGQIKGNTPPDDLTVEAKFGEYASPSFDSQIKTVSEAKAAGIMSIETVVDELYGDSKEEDWKKAEVARLKEEQGVAQIEEPAVNADTIGFNTDVSTDE